MRTGFTGLSGGEANAQRRFAQSVILPNKKKTMPRIVRVLGQGIRPRRSGRIARVERKVDSFVRNEIREPGSERWISSRGTSGTFRRRKVAADAYGLVRIGTNPRHAPDSNVADYRERFGSFFF
jgi:hypothetical protein